LPPFKSIFYTLILVKSRGRYEVEEEQLPDDNPEIEGIKSYLYLLLAYVKGEEYQAHMEKIPPDLKALFEKVKSQEAF
jgi:hypothetical protein